MCYVCIIFFYLFKYIINCTRHTRLRLSISLLMLKDTSVLQSRFASALFCLNLLLSFIDDEAERIFGGRSKHQHSLTCFRELKLVPVYQARIIQNAF